MNITLTCIFLILAANCNPGECLKCYFCVEPAVHLEYNVYIPDIYADVLPEDAAELSKYPCKMKGDKFDPDSNVMDVKEGHKCVQGFIQFNGTKYQIRYKSRDESGCDLELNPFLELAYEISLESNRFPATTAVQISAILPILRNLAISARPGDSAKSASPDDSGNLLNSCRICFLVSKS